MTTTQRSITSNLRQKTLTSTASYAPITKLPSTPQMQASNLAAYKLLNSLMANISVA